MKRAIGICGLVAASLAAYAVHAGPQPIVSPPPVRPAAGGGTVNAGGAKAFPKLAVGVTRASMIEFSNPRIPPSTVPTIPAGATSMFFIAPGAAPVVTSNSPHFFARGEFTVAPGNVPFLRFTSASFLPPSLTFQVESPTARYGAVFVMTPNLTYKVEVHGVMGNAQQGYHDVVILDESVMVGLSGMLTIAYEPVAPTPVSLKFRVFSFQPWELYGVNGYKQ